MFLFLTPLGELLKLIVADTCLDLNVCKHTHDLTWLNFTENLRTIVSLFLGDGFNGCFLMLTPIWGRCPIGRIFFVQVETRR